MDKEERYEQELCLKEEKKLHVWRHKWLKVYGSSHRVKVTAAAIGGRYNVCCAHGEPRYIRCKLVLVILEERHSGETLTTRDMSFSALK